MDCLATAKVFFGNFACEYYEGVKTGYHGCLFRNEGKDMKQQKFFTANNVLYVYEFYYSKKYQLTFQYRSHEILMKFGTSPVFH